MRRTKRADIAASLDQIDEMLQGLWDLLDDTERKSYVAATAVFVLDLRAALRIPKGA